MSHTFATLSVSPRTYAEIAQKLSEAGYKNSITVIGNSVVIDMCGIALELEKDVEQAKDVQVGGGHYKKCKVQPVEYTYKNRLDWFQGECIKYVTRFRDKGGEQDLDKAIHILQLLKEFEYGDK